MSDSGIPKQVGAEQDDEGLYRYIVKFKDTADGIARARRMESRALESQLIDILSDDNAEVMKLMTEEEVREWEERDDVEYVEKGKNYKTISLSLSYFYQMESLMLVCCIISLSFQIMW